MIGHARQFLSKKPKFLLRRSGSIASASIRVHLSKLGGTGSRTLRRCGVEAKEERLPPEVARPSPNFTGLHTLTVHHFCHPVRPVLGRQRFVSIACVSGSVKFGGQIDVISVRKLILREIRIGTKLHIVRIYLLQRGSLSSLADGPSECNSLW